MKALLAALILTFATTAHAEQASCDQIAELAENIMQARQSGVSMAKSMSVTDGLKLVETMVIMAYETTRYSTERNQKREAQDFRDFWYLTCYQSRND